MSETQPPKLIIDSDWKAQAQAEKERLSAAEKAKEQARADAAAKFKPDAAPGQEPEGEFPPADFLELIRMLVSQALLYLGAMPDPETGRRLVSLEMAQFNIDLLAVLEAKTKGNLDEKEKNYLTRVLHELRLQYVEIAKAVAKAVEQGKISPMGGPAPGLSTPGAGPGGPFTIPGMSAGPTGTSGVVTTPAPGIPPMTFKKPGP